MPQPSPDIRQNQAAPGRQCQLCKTWHPRLAKSHILPLGFFKRLPGKGQASTVSSSGERGRRLMQGLYDPAILCDACEHNIMQPLDDYAIKVIRDRQDARSIVLVPGRPERMFLFAEVDRRRLRAFLASVLWRASVSRQPELRHTSIGETYEERIASDLLTGRAFDYIDAVLFHLTDSRHEAFFLPRRQKLAILDSRRDSSPANGWLLQFPGITAIVSLDKRPHPSRVFYNLATDLTGEAHPTPASSSLSNEASAYRLIAFEVERMDGFLESMSKAWHLARSTPRVHAAHNKPQSPHTAR